MKTSTAKIVIEVSLALSAMFVWAQPRYQTVQVKSQYANGQAQPPYQTVQAQPQYQVVQVQPQYSEQAQPQYQTVQVLPQYQVVQVQPQYVNGQAQPQYQVVQVQPQYSTEQPQPWYSNEQPQPWYSNEQAQPWYSNEQAQPWYQGKQTQPRHQHVKAQVPPAGQYQSPKKPKGAIFVGELNAGGEAKEIAVNRVISQCYLEIVSGTVSINTVVIRPEKLALPQATRLTSGQLHIIDLGASRNVTGFRISDSGRGVYRVFVK